MEKEAGFRFPSRPGGLVITREALSFCSFSRRAKLLDIGCGNGDTARHLKAEQSCEIFATDIRPAAGRHIHAFVQACSSQLPFPDESFDGTLLECSLSAMPEPDQALSECRRVLKPGGHLILSDVYARGREARLKGCLARLDRAGTIFTRLSSRGFQVELFRDYSGHLRTQWGQMVMEKGLAHLCAELGADACTLKKIKCGYCLFIARKEKGDGNTA